MMYRLYPQGMAQDEDGTSYVKDYFHEYLCCWMEAIMRSKGYLIEESHALNNQNINWSSEVSHTSHEKSYRSALTSRLSSERIFGSLGEFPQMNKRDEAEPRHGLPAINYQPQRELVLPKKRANGPYTCEDCGKVLKRSSSLSNHKLIHKNVKAYRCEKCGAQFLRKSDLGKHLATHTGSKPYICDICDKSFSQSSNMLTHKRRHTGVKPFKCDYCPKSFYRRVDVKRHEIVHNLQEGHFGKI